MTESLHGWDVATEEAAAIQDQLRSKVRTVDDFAAVTTVAGVDAGFPDEGATTRAAVAVLDFPALTLREQQLITRPTTFPYIPGFLSFREIPAVMQALEQLEHLPDLILCDGHGIMHPRRLGIAAHLGVLLDRPTIGVGKSRLIGTHAEVPDTRGAWVPVYDNNEVIGAVVRTRVGTKPLYISPGHRISLETAIEYVLRCTPKYRLPETTRIADRLASNRGGAADIHSQQTLDL